MINRHRVLTAVAAAWVSLCGAGGVVAQPSPALTPLKASNSLDASADQAIRQAVVANLKKMESGDAAAVTAAREGLVSDAQNGSAAYNEKYAAAVAAELSAPAVVDSQDARKRLNAAVALARIAAATKSPKLQPAVMALMDPKQPEAVQLWALKAAGAILPETLKVDQQRALLKGILPAVKERLASSPMAQEAYDALSVPAAESGPAVVDELLRLTEMRLELYRNQPQAIDEATVDYTGVKYILAQGVWDNAKIVPQAQKAKAMQVVCQLTTLAGQLGDQSQAGGAERDQFQQLIVRVVGSVFVAAQAPPAPQLASVAQNVMSEVKKQNAQLGSAVRPLCVAIQQTPGFEQVQP